MFGTGDGKFMVGVVSRIYMIFLKVATVVSEWNQVWIEAVAGETMASVSPSTAS